jgi:hypothetical protein
MPSISFVFFRAKFEGCKGPAQRNWSSSISQLPAELLMPEINQRVQLLIQFAEAIAVAHCRRGRYV